MNIIDRFKAASRRTKKHYQKQLRQQKFPSYIIDGYIARNGYHGGAYLPFLYFFPAKPQRLERPGSHLEIWHGGGCKTELPQRMFPKLHYSDEPLKVRIEIWKR